MKTSTAKNFSQIEQLLQSRSYKNEKVKGIYYWLWEIGPNFHVYLHKGQFGSNKLFIDAKFSNLVKALTAINGILPPKTGITKNSKFEKFSFRSKAHLTQQPEYEGIRFQFKNAEAVDKFLDVCEEFSKNGLAKAIEKSLTYEQIQPKITSRTVTISTRVGQNKFRELVIKYWKTCAVTDCDVTSVLKSSHIKPWAVADSLERLDAFNGILLTPNLDDLFDSGFISFKDDGAILIASELTNEACTALGVNSEMRLRKINSAHLPYLDFHRNNIYRG
jgi:HNH endonuclease